MTPKKSTWRKNSFRISVRQRRCQSFELYSSTCGDVCVAEIVIGLVLKAVRQYCAKDRATCRRSELYGRKYFKREVRTPMLLAL